MAEEKVEEKPSEATLPKKLLEALVASIPEVTIQEYLTEHIHQLWQRNLEQNFDNLTELLKDADDQVRLRAIKALGEIGSERPIEALSDALKDNDQTLRIGSDAKASLLEITEWLLQGKLPRRRSTTDADDVAYLALELARNTREIEIARRRISELEREVRELSRERLSISETRKELNNFADSLYSFLFNLSLSDYMPEHKFQRYVPIRVFLQEGSLDDEIRLKEAIKKLCETINVEIDRDLPAVEGSLWKTTYAKTKDAVTHPEVSERLKKLERAVELEALDKKQALVDKDLAQAVKTLLDSVQNTPNAVFQIGSILILKLTDDDHGERVITVSLTQEQMIVINQKPSMLTQPGRIMTFLSESSANSAKDGIQKELPATGPS